MTVEGLALLSAPGAQSGCNSPGRVCRYVVLLAQVLPKQLGGGVGWAGVAGWSAVGGASQGTFLVGFLPTSLLQGNLKREEGMAGMVVCSARAAGGVVSARPK